MKKLTINIPDSVELDEKSARMMLAVQLYKQGKLSLGQAGEMAGYTKRTYIGV
jgi:predicted HTH domain antitoxin